MEHIVRLLQDARLRRDRGHGGLPGQPHPGLLRRRLRLRRADGLRHRGDAPRHGRLGPQRHGRARRALPRDLRRRAHRHRPRRHRAGPRRQQGPRHDRPGPGGEPARVRDRDHPRRRLDRAVPREAVVGPGVQRHHQLRDLRARARDLRPHRRRTDPWTSPPRCSRPCSTQGLPLFGAVAEGYWEDVGHPRGLPGRPQGHPRRPGAASRSPASRWATACTSARAPRSTPRPRWSARP